MWCSKRWVAEQDHGLGSGGWHCFACGKTAGQGLQICLVASSARAAFRHQIFRAPGFIIGKARDKEAACLPLVAATDEPILSDVPAAATVGTTQHVHGKCPLAQQRSGGVMYAMYLARHFTPDCTRHASFSSSTRLVRLLALSSRSCSILPRSIFICYTSFLLTSTSPSIEFRDCFSITLPSLLLSLNLAVWQFTGHVGLSRLFQHSMLISRPSQSFQVFKMAFADAAF